MSTACPQCGGKISSPDTICPECVKRVALQEVAELDEDQASAANDLLPETAQRKSGRTASDRGETGGTDGERWGDYELLEPIGRGAMGTVFKARHVRLNRVVALKLISQGQRASENERKRFLREAEAVARLQHPHIVTLYEAGEADGQPFLAMEFVPGKTLAETIGDKPWPPRSAAECVKKISEAVHFAHEHGVLHRDLKPSNVALDLNREPRVMDFGLARLMGQDSEMTLSGMAIGSPSYMAPEQAAGKVHDVSAASDVYSLGAILYEALTARPPFQAESSVETMRQVVERDPVSPRLLNGSVPRDLETICLKSLEKESHRRYATARALAEDLERFLRDESIRARPASSAEKAWRWCRRNRALAASAGIVVALVLTVAIGSPIAALRINRERAAAATEAAKSKQVATFLQSMLEGIKPTVAMGRDTRLLLDILDQTVKRLDTNLKNQPEVEAQLRLVLGQVYEALDRSESAEKHLRISWMMRRKLLGDEHPDTLVAKAALARTLELDDKSEEAKKLIREAVASLEHQFGKRDPRTIEALHVLGNVLKRTGESQESVSTLREVVSLKKAVYGEEDPRILSALQGLGLAYAAANQHAQGAASLEECLKVCGRNSLTNDLNEAYTMGWLACLRVAQERFAEADALFQTSLQIKRRLLPEGHVEISRHHFFMVELLMAQAKYGEAEPLLNRAWELASRSPTEALDLTHDLARQGTRVYANLTNARPESAGLLKAWQNRLAELEGQHPELKAKPQR